MALSRRPARRESRCGLKFLNFVFGAAFYLALVFLSQYAIYATMAYRASRARYREIAFRLEGSAWKFAREAVPYLLLAVVTLGLALPYLHPFQDQPHLQQPEIRRPGVRLGRQGRGLLAPGHEGILPEPT